MFLPVYSIVTPIQRPSYSRPPSTIQTVFAANSRMLLLALLLYTKQLFPMISVDFCGKLLSIYLNIWDATGTDGIQPIIVWSINLINALLNRS